MTSTATISKAPALPDARISSGIALMALAMMITPLLDLFSKLAAEDASPATITAARFIVQALLMLPIVLVTGAWRQMDWQGSLFHAGRALSLTVGMIAFVTALKYMQLAVATAIFFVEPIILTVLAAVVLKEHVGWRRMSACTVGFVGALIVIRPTFADIGPVALLPLITATCVAITAMMTRMRAHRENPYAMQLQMAAWGLVLILPLLGLGHAFKIDLLMPTVTEGRTILWMVLAGTAAALAGVLSTFAYKFARAAVLAPLQYLEIVAATLFGWLVFADFPDAVKWLGILIIVGSGLFIIWRERRLASTPLSHPAATTRDP